MKTILVLLAILIIFSKKDEIRVLFKSKNSIKSEIINSIEGLKKTAKDYDINIEGIYIIFGFLLSSIYGIFYLTSALYINNFSFTIISILLILDTVRNYFKSVNDISNLENYKVYGFAYRFFNLIIDLSYVGYVLRQIFLHW